MFSRIMPAHSPGGMQDHVLTLSMALAQRGHHVSVITSGRTDEIELESVNGVEIYYLKGTPPGRNANAFWFGAASQFEKLHANQHFDIVHSQSVGAYGVYKRGLNRYFRLPLVTSIHGTHVDVLTTSWHTDFSPTSPVGTARFMAVALNLLYRYAYRDVWFIRGSDIVIATSDADIFKYKKYYRLDDAHIRKVYNGIDADLFAPRDATALREQLGISSGQKVLLALSRLEKDKGVQNAIEILPGLLSDFPVCLIVVGDGSYRPALERLAAAKGIAEHVRFVGAQTLAECARYFNLCDVFLDPTLRTDGYDLTIAEAMASAKPVIVSDVGANSTLVNAATLEDGVLIPRGDNRALARETRRLLDNPELTKLMGEKARAKITACFSIPAMVEGMEHVYAEVLGSFKR
ncbi:MAG: glycosyltransferase family 4 protein [Acidobacteriota bacterium]